MRVRQKSVWQIRLLSVSFSGWDHRGVVVGFALQRDLNPSLATPNPPLGCTELTHYRRTTLDLVQLSSQPRPRRHFSSAGGTVNVIIRRFQLLIAITAGEMENLFICERLAQRIEHRRRDVMFGDSGNMLSKIEYGSLARRKRWCLAPRRQKMELAIGPSC